MAISTFKKSVAQTLGLPNAANGIVAAKTFTGSADFPITSPGVYLCQGVFDDNTGLGLLNSSSGQEILANNGITTFTGTPGESANVAVVSKSTGLSSDGFRYPRHKNSLFNVSTGNYAGTSLDYFPQTGKWLFSNAGMGAFGDDVDNFGNSFFWAGSSGSNWSGAGGNAAYFNGNYYRAAYNYSAISYVDGTGVGGIRAGTSGIGKLAANADGTELIGVSFANATVGWIKATVSGGVETWTTGTTGLSGNGTNQRIASVIYADGEFLTVTGDLSSGEIRFAKASSVDDLTDNATVTDVQVVASGYADGAYRHDILKLGSTLIIYPYQSFGGASGTLVWFTSTDGGASWSSHSRTVTSAYGNANLNGAMVLNGEFLIPVQGSGWYGTTDPTAGTLTYKTNLSAKSRADTPWFVGVPKTDSGMTEQFFCDSSYSWFATSDNENLEIVLNGGFGINSTQSIRNFFQEADGKLFFQYMVFRSANTEPTANLTGGNQYAAGYLEFVPANGRFKVLPFLDDQNFYSSWSSSYATGISKYSDNKWYMQQYGNTDSANRGKIWEINGSIYDFANYSRIALPGNPSSQSWYADNFDYMIYVIGDSDWLVNQQSVYYSGGRPHGDSNAAWGPDRQQCAASTSDQFVSLQPMFDGVLASFNSGSYKRHGYITANKGTFSNYVFRGTTSSPTWTKICYDKISDTIVEQEGSTTSSSFRYWYPASSLKSSTAPSLYNWILPQGGGGNTSTIRSADLNSAIYLDENGYLCWIDDIDQSVKDQLAGSTQTAGSFGPYLFEDTYNQSNAGLNFVAGMFGRWIIAGHVNAGIKVLSKPQLQGSAAVYSTVYEEE